MNPAFIIPIFLACAFIIAIYASVHKPDDWQVVWAHVASWTVTHATGYKCTEYCTYEIKYSKYRKAYKLSMSEYTPKEHDAYGEIAIPKLNEFIKSII